MDRSRDGYRGRYRDRHNEESRNHSNYDQRSRRGNYRGQVAHEGHSQSTRRNGTHFQSNPSTSYNHRSSRGSIHIQSFDSHQDRNYPPVSLHRASIHPDEQDNYYEGHSSSARSLDHRHSHPSAIDDHGFISSNRLASNSNYYQSSPSSTHPSFRDRPSSSSPILQLDLDRHRYLSPSVSSQRRESPRSSTSLWHDRSIDYGSRIINSDLRRSSDDYQSSASSSFMSQSMRDDFYRSERYEIESNHIDQFSRDYSRCSRSPTVDDYRTGHAHRKSSSPSYSSRDLTNAFLRLRRDSESRSSSELRDHRINGDSRFIYPTNISSPMDYQMELVDDRNTHRSHPSTIYRSSSNLKRSRSRHDENEFIPAKRSMRR